MSKKSDNVSELLAMLRQLLSTIKDENIPDVEADKIVGRLLSKIDKIMQKIDGNVDIPQIIINKDDHIKSKIQIESPVGKVTSAAKKTPVKKGNKK